MTREQKIEAYSMVLDGVTIREIADKYGVSFQYIAQLFPGARKNKINRKCDSFIFPNISDFIIKNNFSIKEFSEKCGITAQGMYQFLSGKTSGSKKLIDKIIEVTGMTYEQCFSKENQNEYQ